MLYPTVNEPETTRDMITSFAGYNHNQVIGDGEWYDCENLSSNLFPVVSQREDRKTIDQLVMPVGIFSKDGLSYVKADGTVVLNGTETGLKLSFTSLEPKQFVSIGAYVCIFPDKVYINSADLNDYGSMERTFVDHAIHYDIHVCDATGTPIYGNYIQPNVPENPKNGEYWYDTTYDNWVLKKYFSANGTWLEYTDTYISLESFGSNKGKFNVGDSIKISGFTVDDITLQDYMITQKQCDWLTSEYHTIVKVRNKEEDGYYDALIIRGFVNKRAKFDNCDVTMKCDVPDMDYVCESNNRLWGCKYGTVDGKLVNELYCSKLGDFKNWYSYEGLSTDSWAASCGTDGKWTGCITYNSMPTFFKENYVHKIYVSSTGAHQVASAEIRGLQDGAYRSLRIVNETLFYKSRTGIMAYTGSVPTCVSNEFGELLYKGQNASAGVLGNKYYISMWDMDGNPVMMVYDASKGVWQKESGGFISFATHNDTMWMLGRNGQLFGIGIDTEQYPTAIADSPLEWYAESGIVGLNSPDNKYISRFNIRLNMDKGASVEMFIEYDSEGVWRNSGTVYMAGMRSVTIPVPPRRCDHCRIKFVGKGRCRIYSISKVWEQGSDV